MADRTLLFQLEVMEEGLDDVVVEKNAKGRNRLKMIDNIKNGSCR